MSQNGRRHTKQGRHNSIRPHHHVIDLLRGSGLGALRRRVQLVGRGVDVSAGGGYGNVPHKAPLAVNGERVLQDVTHRDKIEIRKVSRTCKGAVRALG